MQHIHSYASIYALGHAAIKELFLDPVVIEEKIDGSQFSFGVYNGELSCRSKGKDQSPDYPDKMFSKGIEAVRKVEKLLQPNCTYRAEYLATPKHNTLAYDRTPKNHLIIFDIDTGLEDYMSFKERQAEAERLGFETVPVLKTGNFETCESLLTLLETPSCLGNTNIEGIVIKNYYRFGRDKKPLMGKYVSEKFKEKHEKDWKGRHESGTSIKFIIGQSLCTEARWHKSIQHLRESGQLTNSPKDIGSLLKEISKDVLKECEDEIKDALFKWAWKDISRMLTRGFPEWYKEQLAKKQFVQERSL